MANGCCTYMPELDDVHRWLPSDVLRDIGIADTVERRRIAVVEDLAARLAGVLGGGTPPREMATTQDHRPQVIGGGATFRNHRALDSAAPSPFMACGPANTMVLRSPAALHQPRQLAPAANHPHPHPLLRGAVAGAAQQPATRRSGGTGFFLPRTTVGATAVPPRHANNAARQRQCRAQRHGRRGYDASAAMARRQQQELIITQAMAANMEHMRQLAGAPVTTCIELALPQEWA